MDNNKVNELNLCIAMIYYILSIMPEERLNLEEIVRILDNEMDIVEKNVVQFPAGHFAKIYYDKLSNLKKEEFDNVVTNLKNKIIQCKDDKIFHNAIMILSSDEQVIGLANCIIEYKGYNSTEKKDINVQEKKLLFIDAYDNSSSGFYNGFAIDNNGIIETYNSNYDVKVEKVKISIDELTKLKELSNSVEENLIENLNPESILKQDGYNSEIGLLYHDYGVIEKKVYNSKAEKWIMLYQYGDIMSYNDTKETKEIIELTSSLYKKYIVPLKSDNNEKKSENNKKTILKFFRNYCIEDEETAQLINYDKTEKDFYIEKDKILNIEGNNCNTKITIKNISDEFVELEIEDSNILTMESINDGVVNIKIEKGKMYEYYLPSAYALTIEIMEESIDKNIKELTIQNGNYIDEEIIKIKRIDGVLKGYYNQRKNMILKKPIEENIFFEISKEETQKLYNLIQKIDFDSNICSDDYLEGGTAGKIVILYEDGNTCIKEFGAYIPDDIAELYQAIKLLCSNEFEKEKSLQIVFGYPISEHIIENVGMVCQDNPEYKSFFEEQKKYIIEEMIEAKDIATINGRKISEYLATIKNSEEFYNIVVAMGESSIYNINYSLQDNKMVYSMEIDNLGLFRTVLIYYIMGILYYWTAERSPITVEITIDKKFEEIFETIRPMLDVVQKMIKGIEEFKIIYK